MNVGLYRAAISMAARQRQLDTIASNLANVGTTGFKRGGSASHQFEIQRPNGPVRGFRTKIEVDFSQGEIGRTGRALDLALDGDGFFAIEGSAGEIYTRDGSLHMTPDGVLVTDKGAPIAWEELNGTVDPGGQPIVVDHGGVVRQGTEEIGRLRIVNFDDPHRLTQDGQGNWLASGGVREVAHTARVHQGALEGSNTNGVEEMVEMIGLQRSFDSAARVLSAIDQTYRRLTRPF